MQIMTLWGSERALRLVGGRVAKNLIICHIRECDCHMATLQQFQRKNQEPRKTNFQQKLNPGLKVAQLSSQSKSLATLRGMSAEYP